MKLYFAPMEGITDSVYRRLHHRYFPGIDRYYMPFFSPTMHHTLTRKEERELPMASSEDFYAIPQVLTKNADDFLWAAQKCAERGYTEINLNLGCPSGTVVAKGKGAGMLSAPDDLDAFLERIYSHSPIAISLKTRLGISEGNEFPKLLEIFNRYPVQELIIHPRVRKDFYKPPLHTEWFDYAVQNTSLPLCYNGDLFTAEDIHHQRRKYPHLNALMLGRGLIGDPGMLTAGGTNIRTLERFHNELLEEYTVTFGSERNAMFRMKENWHYIGCKFIGAEKLLKQLRKTTDVNEYLRITTEIFCTLNWNTTCETAWI